ncbi:MAG TPA: hypothetical protein VMI52_11455 [Acetobacteraceae bacterium]|nr:hypothetical protein [Acetobacteraceae bacterium]
MRHSHFPAPPGLSARRFALRVAGAGRGLLPALAGGEGAEWRSLTEPWPAKDPKP